jgi:hypothetical protein
MTETLGLDIGRVIISGGNGTGDTDFHTGDHLRTPEVPGALEGVVKLARRFDGRVHLVSKCYSRIERRTREWLAQMNFAGLTGITESHWHFCKERPEKGPLCKALGITHFVDDRIDNLHHAHEAGVTDLYWFNPDGEAAPEGAPAHVSVKSWAELVQALAT